MDLEPAKRDKIVTIEVAKLDKLEVELYEELDNEKLTTAQRVGVLSEVRKVIWLRAVLMGLVDVGAVQSAQSES